MASFLTRGLEALAGQYYLLRHSSDPIIYCQNPQCAQMVPGTKLVLDPKTFNLYHDFNCATQGMCYEVISAGTVVGGTLEEISRGKASFLVKNKTAVLKTPEELQRFRHEFFAERA